MLDDPHESSHPDSEVRRIFDAAVSIIAEGGSREDAATLLREASGRGCSEAMVTLGNLILEGPPGDRHLALDMYMAAAELGDSSGMRNMGYCYALGLGCEKDKSIATEWYSRSATAGNARAQCNLGVMYEFGNGVPQSYEEAAKWYSISAGNGCSRGQTNIGVLLSEGRGVVRDQGSAAVWFERSGSPRAKYNLALMYLKGKGVPADRGRAEELLFSSSESGYAKAMVLLARISGECSRSLELYRKAAAKGNEEAQEELRKRGTLLPEPVGRVRKRT